MDYLSDLDDETLAAVIVIYRGDIAEEKALVEGHQTANGENVFMDHLNAIEKQVDEIEKQRTIAKDARLAQSIVDAKLGDMKAIIEIAKQEKQAQEDREYARRLAGQGSLLRQPVNGKDAPPTYEEVIEESSTPSLSKLAGRWVSEKAGRALHPTNESNNFQPDAKINDTCVPEEECVICGDQLSYFDVTTVPCGHQYCRVCLHELFNNSFQDDSLFPPRCCRQEINIETVKIFMTRELIERLEQKTIEFNTTDKTYCANKACNAFIPPQSISNKRGQCRQCTFITCAYCKDVAHSSECQEDPNLKVTLELARQAGWQRCGRCNTMVELLLGCHHITCKCGNQFCYLCGAQPWKSCRCPQWNEDRLLARAEQVARREGRQGLAAVAQVRNELQEQHDCQHVRWGRINGGVCDECGQHLPHFRHRCSRCRLELCRRCRLNRMR